MSICQKSYPSEPFVGEGPFVHSGLVEEYNSSNGEKANRVRASSIHLVWLSFNFSRVFRNVRRRQR